MNIEIKEYPVFVRFADVYYKLISDEYILKVDDWSFTKQIEWTPTLQCDPFGNNGWEFITEDQFNDAHLRVTEFLNSFLPVTVSITE